MGPRIYLRVGDKVRHLKYKRWGTGEVIEEKHSTLAGGCCLVRIMFEDGIERAFINDMDNALCCYYAGVRLLNETVL
jgi:hypothetical protein